MKTLDSQHKPLYHPLIMNLSSGTGCALILCFLMLIRDVGTDDKFVLHNRNGSLFTGVTQI